MHHSQFHCFTLERHLCLFLWLQYWLLCSLSVPSAAVLAAMLAAILRQLMTVFVVFGRAGLGAAWHLAKNGYTVDVLEAGPGPGGLVAGWTTAGGRSVEVGIHGFW